MFCQRIHLRPQRLEKVRDVQSVGQRVVDQQRDRQAEPSVAQRIFAPRDARIAVGGDGRRLCDRRIMQPWDRREEQQAKRFLPSSMPPFAMASAWRRFAAGRNSAKGHIGSSVQ